ncbi:MAG: acyl-CoA dehydrogenase, partial [Chloroflexi bacterium]|nr:acyl-CoA dehydrogenase [Chloroflexota bacterium]
QATGTALLAEGDRARELRAELARGAGLQAASLGLGVGRAANEAAVSYARQRVQGGKPIIEHEAMGTMLADMATRLEMARTLTWKAAWAVDQQQPLNGRLADMAKVVATEAVLDVCRWAMEVHGGSGIMANLPIERYFRDASTLLHADGSNQDHRLRIHRAIKDGRS